MVKMRRSTFAAMCEDSVVRLGVVAEVRGWRVSARGTIATLLSTSTTVDPSLVSVTDASLNSQRQQQQQLQQKQRGTPPWCGCRHEE